MGRARIVDPDTERPPEIGGLPVFDRVVTARSGAVAPSRPEGTQAPEGAGETQGSDTTGPPEVTGVLVLPFDLRSRSRLRARLVDGREVALVLPRGTVLGGGMRVTGQGGCLRIEAADEDVVAVRAADPAALARAAYHLGNRHVPVQIGRDALLFGYDAVLVDMLVRMGVTTQRRWAPFEPEAGAYGQGAGHDHGHSHGSGHEHVHSHGDEQGHERGHGHEHDDEHKPGREHADDHGH